MRVPEWRNELRCTRHRNQARPLANFVWNPSATPCGRSHPIPAMLTRRTFLQNVTAAAGTIAFPSVLRAARPNGFVQVAVIGCKGQGLSDLTQIGAHPKAKFVAFCDV